VLNHPNYTFFIPDKRLYTLFKGTTVTLGFVRASSVSSHGRAPLDAALFISSSYDALYTSDALTCGMPLRRDRDHCTRHPFGTEAFCDVAFAVGRLRGLPCDLQFGTVPSHRAASSTEPHLRR
jgi:hypothetical protein